MFLLSTDYVNNQNIIVTHCDKKPRGKVGGSAISVYQALLHPPIESLGTRLSTILLTFSEVIVTIGNSYTMHAKAASVLSARAQGRSPRARADKN